MKKNKGITLIALIITIIVMLILVAVSVNILIKSNLIGNAEKATNAYKTATEEESNGGKIKIGDTEYDSIDDYVNRNNLQLKYKAGNGKIRVYLRNSVYDYINEVDKDKYFMEKVGMTFDDYFDNWVTNYLKENETTQEKLDETIVKQYTDYQDFKNELYYMCVYDSDEFKEAEKKLYQNGVTLTLQNNNTTQDLSSWGCLNGIYENGTYKFIAKSEDGKTGELEIQTNFEEGKFKFNIEDVGIKEYTFIKGLTWGQLMSNKKRKCKSSNNARWFRDLEISR